MKCPECSKKFKFKNVPMEDRIINAFSTTFKCPECRILLKPDTKFQLLSNASLLIIMLCVLNVLFKTSLNIGLSDETTGILGLIGLLSGYIGFKKTKLLVVD